MRSLFAALVFFVVGGWPLSPVDAEPINLLSLQEGTLPVVSPPNYGGWPAEALLDDSAETGWACETGRVRDNTFVFELVNEATLERFEFDTASEDTVGAGANNVVVETSTASKASGFAPVLQASLAAKADGQVFPATRKAPARWVRLTIRDNHGDGEWAELFSFRGFGERPATPTSPGDVSGTYESSYALFHIRQQGTALTGCYEYNKGLLEGAIEGRVMKLTWREDGTQGPAVMVFSPDGKDFRGYWWHAGSEKANPSGNWDGSKQSPQVGGCPHWAGSVGSELRKSLAASGRARLYGILFDLDSATIRPESRPVLDEVLGLLKAEPSWKLTIEGHTDSTGGDEHNRKLSEARAEAVRAHLVGQGVDASRLKAAGFGESKPVADNATELGRAQNRRVELVRE